MTEAPNVLPPPVASVPQQARSSATRQRLLDATVEALVDRGWGSTTTPEIGRRAGVSQGAVFKHFPNKSLLIAAAIEHLFARLIGDFRTRFSRVSGENALGAAIGILWDLFRDPRLMAAYELYLASRTDPALRAALQPVLERHRGALHAEAARLFPMAAHDAGFGAAVDLVLNALQGAALSAIALTDPEAERAHLAQVERLARRELGELHRANGG